MPTLKHIDNGKKFDWGNTSEDYAKYRDIYPQEFYEKILSLGLCTKGQRVLDLGTGTGVLPRNMYQCGAHFTGADIAENQIAAAKRLSEGMDIDYIVSAAEDISYPDGYFDTVTAVQCFMYFDKDKVLPVIHRILKDGGHFAILFMAYTDCEITYQSDELILKYNPDWNGAHYKPNKNRDLSAATAPDWCGGLFKKADWIEYEVPVKFTRETWHGRMKACRGMGASSLSMEDKAAWEKEHLEFLNTMPETFTIPHWVTILNLEKI